MAGAFMKSRMRSAGNTSYRSLYLNPLNDNGGRSSDEEELHCWSLEKGKKPKQEDEEEESSSSNNSCCSSSSAGKCRERSRKRMLGHSNMHNYYYYYCDWSSGRVCKKVDPRILDGSCRLWEDTGTDAAPASSWSTLPKRSLLCRTLPLDIGRCSCYIIRERSEGNNGALLYSLYTHEGEGREDRKLAVARHGRKRGCSEFIIAQNSAGIKCKSDESFIGTVTANFIGSRYQIWDQGSPVGYQEKNSKQLLAVVMFVPTMTTLMGSFRRIRAYIPKDGSMPMKIPDQTQHSKGLQRDRKKDTNIVHQLLSKVPYYNKVDRVSKTIRYHILNTEIFEFCTYRSKAEIFSNIGVMQDIFFLLIFISPFLIIQSSKQNELDFRERSRLDIHIQPSVKNFQLTLKGGNARQSILLFGKIGKSKYVMEYKSPLTGYQAFAISLASIDSKLCCSI